MCFVFLFIYFILLSKKFVEFSIRFMVKNGLVWWNWASLRSMLESSYVFIIKAFQTLFYETLNTVRWMLHQLLQMWNDLPYFILEYLLFFRTWEDIFVQFVFYRQFLLNLNASRMGESSADQIHWVRNNSEFKNLSIKQKHIRE